MKTTSSLKIVSLLFILSAVVNSTTVYAGNKDRAGQAGASELLINPWARSSGFGGANSASVSGLEAMNWNVAGIANTEKTELLFSHTNWLSGSDIAINSFGFSQKVGESGVIGLSLMSMTLGDIQITTTELPEGGIGSFSPQLLNMHLSYSKEFSNSIYGGIAVKMINEAISDVSAQGVAFDAGIQYVTGANEQVRFGISLRNVGPPMKFAGDGLSIRGGIAVNNNSDNILTINQRSQRFELPSLVNIGGSYKFILNEAHSISSCATFTSNSFTKDQYRIGLQYNFKSYLMIRGGYFFEEGLFDDENRTNAMTGPSAGFTVEIPYGEGGTIFGFDYSYRATNPFQGIHGFGARISL